jgi:hypothetical protein
MRNYCKTIGTLVAVSAFAAGNASAESIDLNYDLHAGYTSEYLFRGTNLGQDLTETGFDASADWNGLALSAGAWYGSYEADTNLDELDLYGEVSKDLGFATAAVGYIWYHNFDDLDDAQEVYFSFSKDFGFLEASLTYFLDVETDNDGYAELALGKSFELSPCLALNLGGVLAYLTEEGHLAHFTSKVSLDWGFAENAKLSPFAAASIDLSGGHGIAYGAAKNELVGGTMVSVSF